MGAFKVDGQPMVYDRPVASGKRQVACFSRAQGSFAKGLDEGTQLFS